MIKQISKLVLLSLMALSLTACFHDEDDESDVHGDTRATATVLDTGADTGRINSSTDIDMFSVFCGSTCTISASTGGTTDTVGRILDGSGAQLASNDDSGTGLNFSVIATSLSAGTYFVEVTGFLTSTGDYTIVAVAQ